MRVGIDIGGSKVELRGFDAEWNEVGRNRLDTPDTYAALLDIIAEQIAWAKDTFSEVGTIGIGTAGRVNPDTGNLLAANLPANGIPFQADLIKRLGQPITLINDSAALALSEAVFGAGKSKQKVLGLVIGTGVGGGLTINQRLQSGPTSVQGEFGHMAAPGHLVKEFDLPMLQCGCGRVGCIETLISGPGLVILAKHLTGQAYSAEEIANDRKEALAKVWSLWCALTAELLHTLALTCDPDVIVLGGGLSRIPNVLNDLAAVANTAQLSGFDATPLALANGGDASGARGAAYAAWAEQND